MRRFSAPDLQKGAGVFDFVMRQNKNYKGREERESREMRPQVAVGVLSSALASGLSDVEVLEFIELFPEREARTLLGNAFTMYDGPDPRLHLWNASADVDKRLHWGVRYDTRPDWMLKDQHRL